MTQHTLTLYEIYGILGKELKPNTVSLGIDQAQNNTGICLLRTDKTKLYVEDYWVIEMKGTGKGNLHNKLSEYLTQCRKVRKDLPKIDSPYKKLVIIEDCYFGLSVWVTKILAKYRSLFFIFSTYSISIITNHYNEAKLILRPNLINLGIPKLSGSLSLLM